MALGLDARTAGLVLGGGGVLVWALALYLGSRAPVRRPSILAVAAMVCLAVYFATEALATLAPDLATWSTWIRRGWWAPAVAAPVWLGVSLALAEDEASEAPDASETRSDASERWSDARSAARSAAIGRLIGRLFWPALSVAGALGLAFGLVGTLTNLVQDWTAPFVGPTPGLDQAFALRHHPAGPLLAAYQLFVLVCLIGALGSLLVAWAASPDGSPVRSRLAWLLASAAMFVVGGGWLLIGSGVYLLPGLPGQVLVILAMGLMGWNMARYGALLTDEQVLGDFLAFGAAMLAIVAVYGAILLTLAPEYGWFERGLPLLLLVMLTHVLVDTRGHLLDRVVFVPLVSTLRGQLRDLANRVVRQPDELTALAEVRDRVDQILREREAEAQTVELRVLVEGALRHLNNLPTLSQHPLLAELPETATFVGTPLERAARLRSVIEQAVERLRPAGARPAPGSGAVGGWLHYLILKEAYVDGRPNKQIMQRYALSESTFHRARRRAIDAITSELSRSASTRSVTVERLG